MLRTILNGHRAAQCLLLGVWLSFPAAAQAMSRRYDGDAIAWAVGDKLCFGGKSFSVPGFFSNKKVSVDSSDVFIHGIEVFKGERDVFWSVSHPPDKEKKRSGINLKSTTCIEYSKDISGFSVKSSARPLEEGLYSVSLYGNDRKTSKRALFFGYFCLKNPGAGLRVQGAVFDEEASRWVCAP